MRSLCPLLCLLWAALGPEAAFAHGVNVFGSIEGEALCAKAFFAKGRPVTEGAMEVRDASGAVLLSGRTDAEGRWCAPAPREQGTLTLIVHAGEGHRAEFALAGPGEPVATPVTPDSLGPTWRDVVGGIGWLIALCASGRLFLLGRKERKKMEP